MELTQLNSTALSISSKAKDNRDGERMNGMKCRNEMRGENGRREVGPELYPL